MGSCVWGQSRVLSRSWGEGLCLEVHPVRHTGQLLDVTLLSGCCPSMGFQASSPDKHPALILCLEVCPGEPKLKQAWSEPGSKLAPAVGEQGPTAYGPHRPRNACLERRRNCKALHVKSPFLRDRRHVRVTAGLWEAALPEPLGPGRPHLKAPSTSVLLLCLHGTPPNPPWLPARFRRGHRSRARTLTRPQRRPELLGRPGGSWSRWASDRAGNTGLGTES